jgi:hypothetical protein
MKSEALKKHLFEHGRMTAYAKDQRQVVWGVIADVDENKETGSGTVKLMNHSAEIQQYDLKNVKGFRLEPYQHGRKAAKLQCDCGCKAEQRYVCENCGATFCGTKHGVQDRDGNGTSMDLCDKCVPIVLGIEKK